MATQTAPRKQQAEQPEEIDPNTALLDEVLAKTIEKIDATAKLYGERLDDPDLGALTRAAITAMAIKRLRVYMTPAIIGLLRELMNTPLGFKTDKAKGEPYSDDVMRDCAIEAILRRVLWTGNEFNIISGQCYITREGYARKLAETPGLTDLVVSPGIPRIDKDSGQTVVKFAASWNYRGDADFLKDPDGKPGRVFAIRVNQGMGPDAVVGKAHRKAFKAIWDQVHGSAHSDASDFAQEPPDETPDDKPANGLAKTALTAAEVEALFALAKSKGQYLANYCGRFQVKSIGQLTRDHAAEIEGELLAMPDAADDGEIPNEGNESASNDAKPDNTDMPRQDAIARARDALKEAKADAKPWVARCGKERLEELSFAQAEWIISELAKRKAAVA